MHIKLLLLLGSLASIGLQDALAADAYEDWNVRFSGSQRTRFLNLDNQFRPLLTGGDQALSLRTLLRVQAKRGPLSLVAEIQDSRVYLNDEGSFLSTIEVNALEPLQVHAAWRMQDIIREDDTLDLKAGRFTTTVGSGRFIARHGFRNTIQNYDGIQVDWQSGDGSLVNAYWLRPVLIRPFTRSKLLDNEIHLDRSYSSLHLRGLFYRRQLPATGTGLDTYLHHLKEGDHLDRPSADRELLTAGFRLFKEPSTGNWDYEVEAAYQWGSRRATPLPGDTTTLDVSTSMAYAQLGYRFDHPLRPRLSLLWNRMTGDRYPGDTDYERFDSLFGPRREFGPTSIFGILGRSNLQTTALTLELALGSDTDLMMSVRDNRLTSATDFFATSGGVRDPSGASGKNAGIQFEFRVRHWFIPGKLRLEAAGAYFRNAGFMENAPNANGLGDPSVLYSDLTFLF